MVYLDVLPLVENVTTVVMTDEMIDETTVATEIDVEVTIAVGAAPGLVIVVIDVVMTAGIIEEMTEIDMEEGTIGWCHICCSKNALALTHKHN